MEKLKKFAIGAVVVVVLALVVAVVVVTQVPGCSNVINELRGDLVGNAFVITTYDDYGQQTLQTSGRRISLSGNKAKALGNGDADTAGDAADLTSVITITIDGREIETCGDTCIFAEKGLEPDVDFSSPEFIESHGGSPLSITSLSYKLNKYKNFFGKKRVVVIKSELGQPIAAYSGNKVYWEVQADLPKTTKLMVDNKALYIHRANFQIVDADLLE